MKKIAAIVLAAGEGTRMKSEKAKVLHQVSGVPMICHVVDTLLELKLDKIYVVIGNHGEEVTKAISDRNLDFIWQKEQLGTGHAVSQVKDKLKNFDGTVLVLYGDVPLIRSTTLKKLLDFHMTSDSSSTILTFYPENSSGYGRILRNDEGNVIEIVEESDANEEQLKIKEANSGTYCFNWKKLSQALELLNTENVKRELYLTDVVKIFSSKGEKISAVNVEVWKEVIGINNREELANANYEMNKRILKKCMDNGVTIMDPNSTYIHNQVNIENDTVIYPFTFLEGSTIIGKNCEIGPSTKLVNSIVEDNSKITYSIVFDSEIKKGTLVGPFSHIRPGTEISENAKVGSFVEIKKSIVGKGSKVPHLSYIGDAKIGNKVNIGAGTVTVNYDGYRKHKTIIGDDVNIGSDSMLVAPIKIGKGAVTGAGSVLTKDVPPDSLALERGEQVIKEGWAKRRRELEKKRKLKKKCQK
ncbi:MAG: bifunctional UDP-N-acetylglucosamine diphosphorylase/glucosamine-1-phosphate N-acetyltransferase GlmU [Actinobacteria bacterium]|nr:bifunctional UDP-N-acetylglucosamine diphosphorylase/glucosamine-1-phosphate N-acetyltransferase GlmU [Actinomycetota bacterium]